MGGFLVPSWIFHLLGLSTFCLSSVPHRKPNPESVAALESPCPWTLLGATIMVPPHALGTAVSPLDGVECPSLPWVKSPGPPNPGGAGLDVAEEMMKPPRLAAGPWNCPSQWSLFASSMLVTSCWGVPPPPGVTPTSCAGSSRRRTLVQRGPLGPTQLDALQRSRFNPEHLLSLGMYRRTIHVAHGLEEPPASSCGRWRTTLEGDFGQREFPEGGGSCYRWACPQCPQRTGGAQSHSPVVSPTLPPASSVHDPIDQV